MKWLSTTKPVTCYLASGWFNDIEEESRQDILKALEDNGISYFSPKDEVLVSNINSIEEQRKAFEADANSILRCDFVIASTAGKDMGTIWESGFSYANKVPVIYYFKAPKGTNFNLMLAHSAYAVAQSPEELDSILKKLIKSGFDFSKPINYEGAIE